ncbi:MAG: 3'(2'),5'-bisphosphate nucleotidase [Candidatus Hydrogenedentota bacterium]
MPLDRTNPKIAFAMEAARQAGLLVKTIEQELVTPAMTKKDRSPVTVADYAAQAVVAGMLERAFPDDVLVAEEDSNALRSAENSETLETVTRFASSALPHATPDTVCALIDRGGGEPGNRFWTLDPIDGTKGFLRREQYAVALALIENGEVRIGALGCPNLAPGGVDEPGGPGSLLVAVRGQGCWVTPLNDPDAPLEQLTVSGIESINDARVLRSAEAGHTNVSQLDQLLAHMSVAANPVCMDSQAKYAMLAAGQGDLLFRLLSPSQPDYREMIWDQAAGSLVVEEAGGSVSDLDGKRLDFTAGRTLARNRGVVASNALLHEAALDAIKQMGI